MIRDKTGKMMDRRFQKTLDRQKLIEHRNLQDRGIYLAVFPTWKSDRDPRFTRNRCVRNPHGAVKAVPSAPLVQCRLDVDGLAIVPWPVNLYRWTNVLVDCFVSKANKAANPYARSSNHNVQVFRRSMTLNR